MKTKRRNLKLIFIFLGMLFSANLAFAQYGRTFKIDGDNLYIYDEKGNLLKQSNSGAVDAQELITYGAFDLTKNRITVKNGEKIVINFKNVENFNRIDRLSGNNVTWNESEKKIEIGSAGSVFIDYYTQDPNSRTETIREVGIHVNYYGVLQYDGKDAPSDIGVVNSTDSRAGKEVNGVFYLSETKSLFVPNHAFKDGMWWEGSLNKDNFVDLRDDQSTNQMSLKEILERAKSRVNGYTNSLNLRIQTNDGTSNGGVYSGSISPTVTITDLRQPAPSLELTLSSIYAPAKGTTETVTVTSNQTWNASSNQAWVSVNPASGTNDGSFTVSVESNTSQQPRTASITVTGGGLSKTITVNQAAALPNPVLELTPSSIYALANGTTETVTVTSNQTWNASSNQAWVSVNPASGTNDGSFTVSVESNTSQQPRTASITVTGGGLKKEIAITQAGEQVITPLTNFKSERLYQRDAIISWTPGSNETEWEVSYGDHNITVNEPKAILRELTPNTEVTVQIRAKVNGELSEPLLGTLKTEDFTATANRIPHLYGMKESFGVDETLPIFWKDLEHLPSAITYNLSITSTPENDTKLFVPLPEAIQFTGKGLYLLTIKFEGHEFEELSFQIEVK